MCVCVWVRWVHKYVNVIESGYTYVCLEKYLQQCRVDRLGPLHHVMYAALEQEKKTQIKSGGHIKVMIFFFFYLKSGSVHNPI